MATNFRVKIGEIGQLIFICHRGIPKRSGISQFRFNKVHWQLFRYIECKFGYIRFNNPKFTTGKDVQTLVDQQFSYVRLAAPLLDTAAISAGFCGAISRGAYSVLFHLFARGVTAMPCGLHTRLCH